jgi:uncharacterized surface protein with fasciclin (FAS1) repeats
MHVSQHKFEEYSYMKRLSIIVLATLIAVTGAVMVQAQDTATPEPTVEPTTDPNATADPDATPEATEEPLPVWVRVVNWTTDGAAVDVLIDEAVTFANVAGSTNTDYQTFVAGEHAFAITPAGTAFDASSGGAQLVEWEEGTRVTIAVLGSAADNTLAAVASVDNYSAIPFGFARIYAYHASPGLGILDIFAGEDLIVTELAYPGTFTDLNGEPNDGAFSVNVPAGVYDIVIGLTEDSAVTGIATAVPTVEGSTEATAEPADDETTPTGLVTLPQFTLEAGVIYTIAVVGAADAPSTFVASMPGVMAPQPSALDIALSSPNYSILAAALDVADPAIVAALEGTGALTVFAPTNAAFDAFLSDMAMTPTTLFADTELLNTVLRYHIVTGANDAAAISALNGQSLTSLQGEPITITVTEDGGVVLNGVANVVTADVATSNGVVHVIDAVLVPPSLVQQ